MIDYSIDHFLFFTLGPTSVTEEMCADREVTTGNAELGLYWGGVAGPQVPPSAHEERLARHGNQEGLLWESTQNLEHRYWICFAKIPEVVKTARELSNRFWIDLAIDKHLSTFPNLTKPQ